MENIIIIGSGPAAFTAAIYAARANLKPLVLEGELSNDILPGGQLMTTTDIENFPGFPKGIDGSELVDNMREQAVRFGAIIKEETVSFIHISKTISQGEFKVDTANKQSYMARSLIIATGAVAKKLSFPGSEAYWMKGISACAVCDGALPMFRNKVLAVIGGGDTAMEEATFLSKFGSEVLVFVRKEKLRASKIMQDRVLTNPKIKLIFNTEVIEAHGPADPTKKDVLDSILVQNSSTGEITQYKTAGLFFAIGHKPASDFLANKVACDEDGYIITNISGVSTATSVPGIFAAGDVQDKKWRQAITAAGSGCMAALECEHYLQSLSH